VSLVKQLLILAVLAGLAFGGHEAWQHYAAAADASNKAGGKSRRTRPPPIVESARAEIRDIETRIDAVGSTRARRAVKMTPLAPGRVTEITFQAGKVVKAGEVLLRLDNDIERADLIEAKARLVEARSALQRARSLKRTSAVAEETVDRQVAALATAQATHDRTVRRLRDRTIIAPFAGTVGFSGVELGARVEDGDTITTLDDLSSVEIEFSLPEGLFGRIKPQQRVVADATAFPDRIFNGVIETINSRIDPVSRSFKARALVANPQRLLPAGMFMHLAVVLDARRALTVLEEALVVDGEKTFVFAIVKGGQRKTADGKQNKESKNNSERAARRVVELGQRSFGFVEITDGIVEGDDIVIRGVQRVRDGAPVRRAKAERGDAPKN
jgi:membrane fusion protein (multidrug efflux system)